MRKWWLGGGGTSKGKLLALWDECAFGLIAQGMEVQGIITAVCTNSGAVVMGLRVPECPAHEIAALNSIAHTPLR